jgi:hypothetical protein
VYQVVHCVYDVQYVLLGLMRRWMHDSYPMLSCIDSDLLMSMLIVECRLMVLEALRWNTSRLFDVTMISLLSLALLPG